MKKVGFAKCVLRGGGGEVGMNTIFISCSLNIFSVGQHP